MPFDKYEKEQVLNEFKIYLKSIQKRCVEILQEEIYTSLYLKYEPTQYERTFQLLQNIISESDLKDGAIYIHLDEENSVYTSAVDGSPQTENIPFLLNYGHTDGTGIDNMYHNYPARYFMEKAARRIRKELGVRVAIIKDIEVTYIDE
jgi:hypothetical protein